MQDIESLKKDADALGVKYRSDIKAETLQAKITDFNKPAEVVEVVEPEFQFYKNTSKNTNAFTEAGRCRPGEVISLTKDQAKQYKDLEPCES